MADTGFALFDTPLGACGIAWAPDGLIGTLLSERDPAATRARLSRCFEGLAEAEPTDAVRAAMRDIAAHLGGARVDYVDVTLDFGRVGAWEAAVYRAARAIPFGETRTYGALAAVLDEPGAAQAVGQALGRNPWPIIVPCHRIIAADGRTGGFSAPGGAATKLRLLEIEGALAADRLPLFAPRD
ncbi:MAG: methylated-DNA--[protein]-cysteine S-methyltransferase [Sphingomonas sp.]|nr:methylated-DNA--[protein]-cysteine S-methyltransferase [Sphingomonas sp.]